MCAAATRTGAATTKAAGATLREIVAQLSAAWSSRDATSADAAAASDR